MLDWVTAWEAQPKLRDGSGFSGWFLWGWSDFEKRPFCLNMTIWKWKMEYVPGNSASLFPFEGWLNDPFKGCFYVTNPTFGDQVRSRRLNHLVSKILWVLFSDCRVIQKSFFRGAEMMTLNLPQVLLGKSWPQRWWVTPPWAPWCFFFQSRNPRNPPAKCWKESFRFFRNSSDFFS